MLSQITINDFAIVDHLDLEMNAGMTVVSGETGAGKSIMLDALGLTLGDRTDASVVRHGCEKAEIHSVFDISNHQGAQTWLQRHELSQDDNQQLMLRRIISKEGRSRAYVNGRPTSLADLKTLGNMLIDIHSQHEHQSLLQKDTPQKMLDGYAKAVKLQQEVHKAWQQWQQTQQKLSTLTSHNTENQARAQLLAYQIDELEQLGLQDGELKELFNDQKRLANAEQNLLSSQQALSLFGAEKLQDEDNALDQLNKAIQLLDQIEDDDKQLVSCKEMLANAQIQIDEAGHELSHYLDNFEVNPQRLHQVEERLSAIYDLARKHNCQPVDLITLQQDLQDEFESLDASDERIEELQLQVEQLTLAYLGLANRLSKKRQKAAKALSKEVNTQLTDLGMAANSFNTKLITLTEGNGLGLEQIEFEISPNPGQPGQPLHKIASGGELSRISLAIQVVSAKTSAIPTLVFDEVDVGIGGGTAEVVGRLLRQLGDRGQVICVTHQAQVASQGHQHLQVSKLASAKSTKTNIRLLQGDQRTAEVARMLGGIEITQHTLTHASEMLGKAG